MSDSTVEAHVPDAGVPNSAPPGQSWREAAALALRDTVPVAMGYLPLGAAYGLLLVNAGIGWYWAPISSLIVFAGAMQFLSVSLIAAHVPLLEVATSTLAINFRHVFYGLSFPLGRIPGRPRRLYGVFALTDETYSLVAAKADEHLGGRRIHLVQVFSHGWWILGSSLGAAASIALPKDITGLDFALTALFVVLAQEHAYRKENLRSLVYGALAACFTFVAFRHQFLAVAIGSFLVLVAARFVWDERMGRSSR